MISRTSSLIYKPRTSPRMARLISSRLSLVILHPPAPARSPLADTRSPGRRRRTDPWRVRPPLTELVPESSRASPATASRSAIPTYSYTQPRSESSRLPLVWPEVDCDQQPQQRQRRGQQRSAVHPIAIEAAEMQAREPVDGALLHLHRCRLALGLRRALRSRSRRGSSGGRR